MIRRQIADDGRLDVEAAIHPPIGQPLAADEDPPVVPRLRDGGLVTVDGTLVDDWAEPVLAEERIADRDRLRLLDEQPDELVVDGLLDVDTAVGRAFLAAKAEGRAHDPLGGLLEVRLA